MAEPSRIRTIALFYGHVARNIGDLAINRGQVAMLARAFPGAALRVALLDATRSPHLAAAIAAFGPEGTVDFVHVRGDPRRAVRYALDPAAFLADAGLEAADLVVLASGEHLFQYEAEPNRRNLFWRSLPAFAAQALGRPCLLMPSTFGPFEEADGRVLAAALFAAGPRAAARDARSPALLAAAAARAAPATGLDPAFFLPPPAPADRPGGRRTLGLVMRSEDQGMRQATRARRAAAGEDAAGGRGVRFGAAFAAKVLATDTTDLRILVQTETDRPVAEAIAAAVPGARAGGRLTIAEPPDIDAYLAELAALDGVVAARFHALVMGLVARRPVFGVHFAAHGPKIPGLFELLGCPDRCADLTEGAPEAVAATAFARLMAAPPPPGDLAGRLDALRDATLEWMRADWPAAAPETRLEAVRALGVLAARLADDAADKAVAHAETRAAALEKRQAELERERAALRAARAERDRLAAELDRLLAEAAQARRQQVQQLHAQRLLEHQASELRGSVSFRLGHALVLGFRSPRRLLELPGDVARLYREGRAKLPRRHRGDGAEERYGRLTAEERERLAALYAEGGADAVAAAVLPRHPDDRAAGALALLAAGNALVDASHRAAGLPLATAAVRHARNEQTLRALFWAASREDDFRTAGRCFAELEDLLGPDPSAEQVRWLEKLQRSPAHVASAATRIPPRAARTAGHPRRLCYVLHNSWPYSSGGYATRAHGLAASLQKAGWEVVALARPGFPLDQKPELRPEDVPLAQAHEGVTYRFLLEPARHSLSRRDYMLVAADRIEAALRDIRPEVVVAASAHLSALPALIAARRLGIPFAYEVRGFWEVTRQSRKPEVVGTLGYRVDVALEAIVAQEADHVFTLTEPMREELAARGVDTPITLLPNSCDPDRFVPRPRDEALAARLGIPPGVPVIGYIGTFVQYEGLEHLAEACARLAAQGVDFRLLLVGNEDTSGTGRGPVTTEILEVAVRTGLAGRLIMPGRVPHDEVEAYYSLIDIAPFPRKPQPVTEMVSPMKPLEALAMEKAVVVSSVRALTEMIRHEETGLVFEKGSIDSLTDTLARLIAEPDLRARLGQAARAWVVRERTWEATARAAAAELERVVGPASLGVKMVNG